MIARNEDEFELYMVRKIYVLWDLIAIHKGESKINIHGNY